MAPHVVHGWRRLAARARWPAVLAALLLVSILGGCGTLPPALRALPDAQVATSPGSGGSAVGSNDALPPPRAKTGSGTSHRTSPPTLHPGDQGPAVVTLQQSLAALGYLPVQWVREGASGTWVWRWPVSTVPESLRTLWTPGTYNVLTQAAVMAFQAVNGLAVDGVAGPQTQAALAEARARHRTNPWGYTFVSVSESRPETLTLWHDGQVVLTTRVNTGIPESPTVIGTYPVYLQYRSQTMSGVTPWGEHYSDPGVPYVSYFYRGEAIHGFERAAYGYPQSLGCVELPVSKAAQAWPYLHIGTLVHIEGNG
ncbi:MAG: murein L,D-transpeptidase [Thermoflavifilum sp.]|nr:murein L,D-transpeptidase [Thermoflavifilum sp.]MCL6513139.1 L,D-transpeptidase family protein [Alicyclobacillus sp.]